MELKNIYKINQSIDGREREERKGVRGKRRRKKKKGNGGNWLLAVS